MTNTYPAYAEHAADESIFETVRVWKSHTGADYEAIVTMAHHRLRIAIHFDSYDFQSLAMVERWDGERWERVVRWDGNSLTAYAERRSMDKPSKYRSRDLTVDEFDPIPHALLCNAATVIA